MDGLDREFDRMITSKPCDYRHKFVRLHQVLSILGFAFLFLLGIPTTFIWQLLAWTGVLLVLSQEYLHFKSLSINYF